ncbi:MAG: carbohydrate ABC transporter permease, partial [Mesorhizobium sp.]
MAEIKTAEIKTAEIKSAAIKKAKRQELDEGGMGYLQSLPRRVVTVYLPLLVFVIVL